MVQPDWLRDYVMVPERGITLEGAEGNEEAAVPPARLRELDEAPQITARVNDAVALNNPEEAGSIQIQSQPGNQNHVRIVESRQNSVQTVPNVKWGNMIGLDRIKAEVDRAYMMIVTWQKNTFTLPRGSGVSKDVIGELTRLIKLFNTKSPLEPVAISLLTIFLPLILQKPSRKSKKSDHVRYLKKRCLKGLGALWCNQIGYETMSRLKEVSVLRELREMKRQSCLRLGLESWM